MDERKGWREGLAVALLSASIVVPAYALRHWWVEDAAISFSYARNLVAGDGLVPFAGGERAEGYSDPLWVALLALGQAIGLDPFPLSKVLGAVFAAGTVPLGYLLANAVPVDPRSVAGRATPLVAALLVAANAQHAIWACSGLEDALFAFLMGLGAWRLIAEAQGGFPWSAVVFLGLALTHPEGVVYAAFAWVVGGLAALRQGRPGWALRWAAVFGVPFAVYQAIHLWYFAYPFPLPYYAKVVDSRHGLLKGGGWSYLSRWALGGGWAYTGWIAMLGVTRLQDVRWKLGLVALVALGAALALPANGPPALVLRASLLVAVFGGLPLLALRSAEALAPARLLAAGCLAITVTFAVGSGGDWMSGGRRWDALALPLAVLYAAGIADLAGRLPARLAPWALLAAVLAPLGWNADYLWSYVQHPESMTPLTTRDRVASFQALAERLHLDRPWVAVDHAMGGSTWFAPPGGRVIDWYGLTDVTFAMSRPLTHNAAASYLLGEPVRMDFAHIEDWFSTKTSFRKRFVEIPKTGGRTQDDWVARSLLTAPRWLGDAAPVGFDRGARLEGFTVRAPEVRAGAGLYFELGLHQDPPAAGFDVVASLRGPGRATYRTTPGYGILPPDKWRPDEVFVGRYVFPLPAELPEGTYDLGFAVVDPKGAARAALTVPPNASADADGTVWFPAAVRVLPQAEVDALAQADWLRADALARSGDCAGSEEAWGDALAHEPTDPAWRAELDRRAQGPLAGCWADRVAGEGALPRQLADLARARRWDPRSPAALRAGAGVADALWGPARAARDAGDQAETLRLFEAVVTADPSRSWARRYAEEARSALRSASAGR